MAVDTQRKRFAMLGFGEGAFVIVPDATVTALDRATLLHLYGFTDADDAPAAESVLSMIGRSGIKRGNRMYPSGRM